MLHTLVRSITASALLVPLLAAQHENAGTQLEPITSLQGTGTSAQDQGRVDFDKETGELVFQDEEPIGVWKGAINLGASLSSGNTARRSVFSTAEASRRGENDRITLSGFWNYSDERVATGVRQISQRRTRGKGQYDYFLNDCSYLFASISAENDVFQDLDLRLIVSAGYGRQLFDKADFKLNFEIGIAYYDEARNFSPDSDYVAARGSYHLEWDINDRVKFLQDVEFYPSLEEASDIYVRKDSRLQMALSESMNATFQWVLDYDNTPAPGLDRVDNLFLISVGYSF